MRKVLFFHTSWCGPCRKAKRDYMDLLAEKYPDRIKQYDAELYAGMYAKYHLEHVPAFVLAEGEIAKRIVYGGIDPVELEAWIRDES